MTKKQFATLIFCTVAGMIFALGMCMCLLPEWNAFTPGVVMTAIGGVMLLVFGIIALIKNRKNAKPLNWKLIGKISYAIIASLVLGTACIVAVVRLNKKIREIDATVNEPELVS